MNGVHTRGRRGAGRWSGTSGAIIALTAAGLAASVFLGGCGNGGNGNGRAGTGGAGRRLPPSGAPIVVFGVDGLEWDVLLEMLAEGRLPNYARLIENGTWGELDTLVPTMSPIIWTTIATGKPKEQHGILHFARENTDGDLVLYNRTDRRTKAIWNILSDYDRPVNSVGWWMTFPVEEIDGVMVAQTNTEAQIDKGGGKHVWKGTLFRGVPGQVHPPARQNGVMNVVDEVESTLDGVLADIFGTFPHAMEPLEEMLWDNCRWAFRADNTYLRIAEDLLADGPAADLTLVYFGGTDVAGHRFWRYMRPQEFAVPPRDEAVENFGTLIEDYYAYSDAALGRLMAAAGADATFIVISDHGMHAANTDSMLSKYSVNSGDHLDGPPGVFLAAGPIIEAAPPPLGVKHIKRDDVPWIGAVVDITPTLLAAVRLPRGRDMSGTVLTSIFRPGFQIDRQPEPVPSHDSPAFLARQREDVFDPGEAERIRQLRSLGYLGDAEGEPDDE